MESDAIDVRCSRPSDECSSRNPAAHYAARSAPLMSCEGSSGHAICARSGYRILIVDDEPDLLSELADYFARRGDDVTVASCVAEAKARLSSREDQFDALVTDLRMPDGSGFDVVSFQRSNDPNCLCFVITGHLEEKSLSPELGVAKVYQKPFKIGTMHREIHQLLGAKAAVVT